jgi:hypothetical protein
MQFITILKPAALHKLVTLLPSLPLILSTLPDKLKLELSDSHCPKRQKPKFADTYDAQAITHILALSAL